MDTSQRESGCFGVKSSSYKFNNDLEGQFQSDRSQVIL